MAKEKTAVKESKEKEVKLPADPTAENLERARNATSQDERDRAMAAAMDGGRADVAAAPPAAIAGGNDKPAVAGGEAVTSADLANHPVEKAKAQAREHAKEHLSAMVGDGSNMTATARKAVKDQLDEIEVEEQSAPEPARGVEQSVGTERKEGIRVAPPNA